MSDFSLAIFKIVPFILFAYPTLAQAIDVPLRKGEIHIDGIGNEQAWQPSVWLPVNQLMVGELPSKNDFNGRFKLLWDENYLYLLAEITDDVLFDQHANPLFKYWDDDCLEIFIDEDNSKGNHQFNFNAFAYHVALDNQVADIGPNNPDGSTQFILLNDHIDSQWQRVTSTVHNIVWELKIKIFDNRYSLLSEDNHTSRVKLSKNKKLGFMLAYCDNDGSIERESFIGSTKITPVNGDRNLGYITADVFDEIILVD